MKVCHITSAHPHTSTRILLKECQTLAENGMNVSLIAPNAPFEKQKGVQLIGVQTNTKNRLIRMSNTVRKVYKKSLKLNADVYHFHDPELLIVGFLLKKKGKKVIYDVHEDVPVQILYKEWLPKNIRKIVSKSFQFMEDFFSKKFDGVVTATPFIDERYRKIGCKTVNINNYPFINEIPSIKNEIDIKKESNTACYIGGITYVRGIVEMIQALNYTDARLTLAGNYMDNCDKETLINIDGWEKVNELGFVNREEVSNIMKTSNVGLVVLHPIRNYIDSLPIKMFEYMSNGLPIICSDFPLWKTIIDEVGCGICVDPLNPEEIGKAIQWVIENPAEAAEMGQRGKEAVQQKFNWSIEGSKLVDFYKTEI